MGAPPGTSAPRFVGDEPDGAEEGRRLLSESSLDVTLVDDLNQAASAIKAAG